MASERPPLWKRAFDAAEKSVAPKLEAAVRTERFAETASAVTKLQARARREANERSQRAMHNWNMPTATDMKRLREQLTSLERAVRDLTKQVDSLQQLPLNSQPAANSGSADHRAAVHRAADQPAKQGKATRDGKPAQPRRSRNSNQA